MADAAAVKITVTTRDALKAALDQKNHELTLAKAAQAEATRKAVRLANEVQLLEKQLAACPAPKIEVSDHALVRYAERVLGMDADALRARILAEIAAKVVVVGDGKFPLEGGGLAVVRNRNVVTVVPP